MADEGPGMALAGYEYALSILCSALADVEIVEDRLPTVIEDLKKALRRAKSTPKRRKILRGLIAELEKDLA